MLPRLCSSLQASEAQRKGLLVNPAAQMLSLRVLHSLETGL